MLIPRADTELLVDLAIRLAPDGARALDLGTGSGAIAVAVAAARPDLRIVATDLSQAALAVAAGNAEACLDAGRPGGPLRWLKGSWWAALPSGEPPFDLIASNPPYIAEGDPHLARGDLRHEPAQALASGADGLDAIREIAAGARGHLAPGGWLLVEHGFDQGPAVRALFEAAGLRQTATHRDAEGRDRVTAGRCPSPQGDAHAFDAGCASSLESFVHLASKGTMEAKEFIAKTVAENPVVLFMKGTAQFPQCGFSGRAVQILKACGVTNLVTVNVLDDDEVRQGIKDYSNWPTIPQLYVNGEFVGGADIMYEMYQSGELQKIIPQQAVA